MSDEVKQREKNRGTKRTLKVVVITVICTLLFVVILLLFILLGLKKCSNRSINSTSSSASSEKYDSGKLDDIFKKIVWAYLDYNGAEVALSDLNDVVAVTYEDNHTSFGLEITVKSNNRAFHYSVMNKEYSNHEDFLEYLLDDETDLLLDSLASIYNYSLTNETITTDKTNYKYLISETPTNVKYFSGFYFENNEYRVYQKKELISNNPFNESPSMVITNGDLLYGYYQHLMN